MGIGAALKANMGFSVGTIIAPMLPAGITDMVAFDVTTRRSSTNEIEVSEFPVEASLAFANDNVTILPDGIQVSGVLVDVPLFSLLAGAFGPGRALDALTRLRTMAKRGEPVQVLTDLGAMPNLMIRSIALDEDASTGDGLFVTVTLREVQILSTVVTSAVVLDAAALIAGAAGTADIGLLPGSGLVP